MRKIRYLKDGMFGKTGAGKKPSFFISEENEVKFKLNCQTQQQDWIYRTETITYQYNQHGHRCVDIENLDKRYILFAGCSHTEGIGLKLENTYSYLVAQHYNTSYYNLAIGGAGPYTVMYNILGFLSKVKFKPLLVILQWPDFERYYELVNTDNNQYMFNYLTATHPNDLYKSMLMHNVPYKQNVLYRQIVLQNLRNYGIDLIIENCIPNVEKDEDDTVKCKFGDNTNHIDQARDLCHAGNLTNEVWANEIINTINKNFAHVLKL